ncbi:MAG: histidine triad nucleotide-binding protein [Reinekea sp.]|jgi:histidine triad (HIT) family protein
MTDCLFCKIVNGDIPSKKVYEDDDYLAFWDIAPKAPIHLLLIPKQHIINLYDLNDANLSAVQGMIVKAPEIARNMGLEEGFRLVANTGPGGGQEVDHIHFHILGDVRKATWSGFPVHDN